MNFCPHFPDVTPQHCLDPGFLLPSPEPDLSTKQASLLSALKALSRGSSQINPTGFRRELGGRVQISFSWPGSGEEAGEALGG